MFLLALKKLGMSPQEVIFVGDSQNKDIAGANAAGMDTVWITENKKINKKGKEDYSTPDYYIKEIPQVLDILEKLNEKVRR